MALKRRDDIDASRGVDVVRRARRGLGSLVYVAVVVVAVVVVVVLSLGLRRAWDVSRSGSNLLSPQSLEILERLEEPVRVHALFTKGHPRWETYFYLLQRYRNASDRIEVEFIDPVAQPGRVKQLGLETEQEAALRDGDTVVVRQGRKHKFRGISEEDVTNAIVAVGSSVPRVVGFIRGYGEKDPESPAPGGFSRAIAELRGEYYEVVNVSLDAGVPEDITVLVSAGPKSAMPVEVARHLEKWLRQGGRLLALADPGQPWINQVVEPWGLRATGEWIELQRKALVKVLKYTDHEIVEGFGASLPTWFAEASPVAHFEADPQLLFHDALAVTSDFAIANAKDGTRRQGPFAVGAAVWVKDDVSTEAQTRVVLIGDSDFASNQYLRGANLNFFLNCVGWLTREDALVSVRRGSLEDQSLALGPADQPMVVVLVFAIPAVVCVAGVLVFLRRRGL